MSTLSTWSCKNGGYIIQIIALPLLYSNYSNPSSFFHSARLVFSWRAADRMHLHFQSTLNLKNLNLILISAKTRTEHTGQAQLRQQQEFSEYFRTEFSSI